MKYLPRLWQLVKESAKAKSSKEFWERVGKDPRSQNSNTRAKINNQIFAIQVAYEVGAIDKADALRCPNCKEIIPSEQMVAIGVEPKTQFFCPCCSELLQGSVF